MSETPIELMLAEYDRQVEAFYTPIFNNQETAKAFIDKVHSICNVDEGASLQMLFQVERFVSLADDIDKLRPSRDGLRILFFRTCLESLSSISCPDKSTFFRIFSNCFSDNGKLYILDNFYLSYFKDEISGIGMVNQSADLEMNDFLEIIREIRNKVVHDGVFWETQVFAQDDDSVWITSLTTDKRILSTYPYPNGKKTITYYFSTTLQYESFRYYFVEACVNYINKYIQKLNIEENNAN